MSYKTTNRNPIGNKEEAMKVVGRDRMTFRLCSPELQDDFEVALEAVRCCRTNEKYVSDSLRNSKSFVKEVLAMNVLRFETGGFLTRWPLELMGSSLLADRTFIFEVMGEYKVVAGKLLYKLSEKFKDDRELVLSLVQHDGTNYQFASERLKLDREIVLTAVGVRRWQHRASLRHVPKHFLCDRQVVVTAVTREGKQLRFVPEPLLSDYEVVHAAVTQGITTRALKYVPEQLRGCKELVLDAVAANSFALRDASDGMKNDRDVVLVAVNRFGDALQFASETMRNDEEVALTAVAKTRSSVGHVGLQLRSDRRFMLSLCQKGLVPNEWMMRYASVDLQKDPLFIEELEAS